MDSNDQETSLNIQELSSNISEEEFDDNITLTLINRRTDNVAVMRMAPINTDLNVPPPQVLDSAYYEAFRKRSRKFFKTSLDMGYSFANDVPSVNIVGSGSAIKKLLMEPYAAGPLSLICHRVGKTVYLDNHSFTRKQKCELLPQLYWKDEEPSPNFTPQLSLYENLIWNSPITSTCTEPGAGAELVLRETG
ncbi:hypothetical protein NECAME_01779 [Necator americanus]|nr:hypothetical protein NECAME_01779 [Necator americanus]ETN83472.1 hypothetical protein NECAME_01779 [Necator americanus]